MSEIEKTLKEETKDFHITNDERLTLVEVLACVASVLRTGDLFFNGRGPHNKAYADLCTEMAKRFANMPVHQEN